MQRRGLTLAELLIALPVLAVMAFLSLFAVGNARTSSRQLVDANQIKQNHTAFVTWGGNNDGDFPMPSRIDRRNATIGHPGIEGRDDYFRLDSTRAIFSLLLFNGSATTDIYVSPAEAGPVDEFDDLMTDEPTGAADPENAMWDPVFRVHPTNDRVHDRKRETAGEGNLSYAHAMPFGARRNKYWNNSFMAQDAAIANRGASWSLEGGAAQGSWQLLDATHAIADDYSEPVGELSNTLLIHGERDTWEGNVAYNDNHVDFEERADPENVTWVFLDIGPHGRRVKPDNLFANEDDRGRAPEGGANPVEVVGPGNNNRNNYLRSYSDRIEGTMAEGRERVLLDVFYD